MDINADSQMDPVERRRLQNRVAQRKFREKKRRGTETRKRLINPEEPSAVTSDDLPTISMSLPSESPINRLAETLFDSHTADELLYQGTQEISFPTPDMSQLVHPALEEVTSWDPGPWNALSSPENINLSHSNEGQHPPFQPRSSDSDLSPSTNSEVDNKSMSRLITKVNDEKGWISGLHIAAQTGNEQIVRVLLSSGNMDVNQQDSDDRTPLLHAVMENHESVVRLLLKHGARIGILDCDGRSGIQWAILRRHLTILQLLLEHRAEYEQDLDIDSSDNTGWTALHMAIVRSFEPAVSLLIQLGANVNAKAHKCPFQERSR